MLFLYQRTMFGKIENPKNERLLDLNQREFATFAPLLVLAVWMGIYPAPFLRRLETSVRHIVSRVSPEYEAKYAANCDPTPTPARIAAMEAPPGGPATPSAPANPAARFLAAVPCDA